MKSWTISVRLYLLLGLLLALLLAGVLTLIVASKRDHEAAAFHERLGATAAEVRYDMLQMSDALRRVLLDPEDDEERRRKVVADEALVKSLRSAAGLVVDWPDLRRALGAIDESDAKKL